MWHVAFLPEERKRFVNGLKIRLLRLLGYDTFDFF
jgi:hypothetical protein